MCKGCFKDITNYKRWQIKPGVLTPAQLSTMHKVKGLIEHNIEVGGFVPKFFIRPFVVVECETCGQTFETSSGMQLCWSCQSKESQYLKLLRQKERGGTVTGGLDGIAVRNKKGTYKRDPKALHEYDAYYAELNKRGKRVPNKWKELWG
jgi:hypothetical protein